MIQEENGIYRVTANSALADGMMILFGIGGFVTLIVGVGMEPTNWHLVFIGVASVAAGVLMLTVCKFRKLVAVITEEGITEHVSKVSGGLIRWEEIESVVGTRQNEHVGITLVDLDAHLAKLNVVQKGIIQLGLTMGYAPINIPCNLLDEPDEFVEICNRYIKKKSEYTVDGHKLVF